jgi:hypothetical protein
MDAGVLLDLTDQDLEKIGIPLGHRKKLLRPGFAFSLQGTDHHHCGH